MTSEAKRTVPITQPKVLATDHQKTVALSGDIDLVLRLVERALLDVENSPSVAVRIIFSACPAIYQL